MEAKNMQELENMLFKEMKKAMNVVSQKALADMHDKTGSFYTGGTPQMYERTGALGDTPKTTALTIDGKTISFEAYLDDNYRYTTGKSPTMKDVLNLTNNGKTNSSVGKLQKAVGRSGYWEEAEKDIKKDLDDTMRKFFK